MPVSVTPSRYASVVSSMRLIEMEPVNARPLRTRSAAPAPANEATNPSRVARTVTSGRPVDVGSALAKVALRMNASVVAKTRFRLSAPAIVVDPPPWGVREVASAAAPLAVTSVMSSCASTTTSPSERTRNSRDSSTQARVVSTTTLAAALPAKPNPLFFFCAPLLSIASSRPESRGMRLVFMDGSPASSLLVLVAGSLEDGVEPSEAGVELAASVPGAMSVGRK